MASKQKKKRSKKYSGSDAKISTPNVVRVSAEERSAFKEWWLTNKLRVRIGGIIAAVSAAVGLIITGIIGLF